MIGPQDRDRQTGFNETSEIPLSVVDTWLFEPDYAPIVDDHGRADVTGTLTLLIRVAGGADDGDKLLADAREVLGEFDWAGASTGSESPSVGAEPMHKAPSLEGSASNQMSEPESGASGDDW